jgi:methyl-accepting chemotaxis protein
VANLVTEISNASREQSSGIEQVTQAVSQMDEVTQQNAALVEQAAAAAESLEDQARGLLQAVGSFKLAEGRALTVSTGKALAVVGGMDFDAAINAHRQWRRRLLDMLTGASQEKFDPEVVGCDDKCALGQWIYGSCKPAMGNDPLCENLRLAHHGFHQCAAEVIRHHGAGRVTNARQLLAGEFVKRSDETVGHIEAIRAVWSEPVAPARNAAVRPVLAKPIPLAHASAAEDEWKEF